MAHGSTVADGPLLDHGATWGHVLQVRTAILCRYFANDRPPKLKLFECISEITFVI